ncbi:MAG: hypothetical protein KBD17_02890 [Candidatus Pacebacteria bacterium]|nr:hypothetical protein [Candidatus Paceibacterota bacterium]
MRRLSSNDHQKLVALRKLGKSIPEISKETGIAKTTVLRHIQSVQVPAHLQKSLKEKQGGSKARAEALRENMSEDSGRIIGAMSDRDYFFLLIGLYWGEGTKKDFAIINSDPRLIQAFIICLQKMGIPRNRLSFTIRIHSNISAEEAKEFWSHTTKLPRNLIQKVEVVEGKKKGKLPYGMCRIRVKSGIRERLLIQSAIALVGKSCNKKLLSPV